MSVAVFHLSMKVSLCTGGGYYVLYIYGTLDGSEQRAVWMGRGMLVGAHSNLTFNPSLTVS